MRGLLIALLLTTATLSANAQQSAQDTDWIAHCVSQISETNKSRAEKYCACMAEGADTSEKLRQTDLERALPPLHRLCFEKAGFRAPN